MLRIIIILLCFSANLQAQIDIDQVYKHINFDSTSKYQCHYTCYDTLWLEKYERNYTERHSAFVKLYKGVFFYEVANLDSKGKKLLQNKKVYVDSLFEYPMGERTFKLNGKKLELYIPETKDGVPKLTDTYIISQKGNKILVIKQRQKKQ